MTATTANGYLELTDPQAIVYVDGSASTRPTVAAPTDHAYAVARSLGPEALRGLLHKRPGVNVQGRLLPMDWPTWDRLRRYAWGSDY